MIPRHAASPLRTCALALLLLGAGLWPAAPEASPTKPLDSFFHETWSTREGLPHNQVNGIAQSSEGYLWFATWEGLARYDGTGFRHFDRSNVPGLRDNGIRAIRADPEGGLLLATARGGISQLRDGRAETIDASNGLVQDQTMDVLRDHRGRLWIALESGGVQRLDGDGEAGSRHFGRADGLPSDLAYTLLEDVDGAIWVGTADGLALIREDRVRVFDAHGLPDGSIFSLARDGSGNVLVGTMGGPYRLSADGGFVPVSGEFPRVPVTSLREDADGALWVGTTNRGLLRVGPLGVERLRSEGITLNARVAALHIDHEGGLWAGTNTGALRLRDAPFSTYNSLQGMGDDYVRALLQGSDGSIWAGTSHGLNHWDGTHWTSPQSRGDLPSLSLLALHEDADGSLWLGSYVGVHHWVPGEGIRRTYTVADGLMGNQVRAILRDPQGSLWLGTSRGVSRMDPDGHVQGYGLDEGLPSLLVHSMHLDRDGVIWIGTSNGVARIAGGRVQVLDLAGLDEPRHVFGFHEEDDGTLWLASDRGLLRHRAGTVRRIGLAQGLPVETLFQIVADGSGALWLTSNRGVARVDRLAAHAVADGAVASASFDLFGEADGMASAQCNGGGGPAALRSLDGRIWVATAKGAAVVDPARATDRQRVMPRLVVEEVHADGLPLAPASQLQLPLDTRRLAVRFAGISFENPALYRFRYRLEGFDGDWIDAGALRTLTYTNLRPGQYRLRLAAGRVDTDWGPDEVGIDLHLPARPWERTEMQVAAVLLLMLAAALGLRLRAGRVARQNARLQAMVAERTAALSENTRQLSEANLEKTQLAERLQHLADRFRQQANEDSLTGIGNRRFMHDALAEAVQVHARTPAEGFCVLLLDLDHFKQINDQHSHAAGDEALRRIAASLRATLPPSALLARWGGEEFAVLLRATPLDRAVAIADALRRGISIIDTGEFAPGHTLAASIGVAEHREGESLDALLGRVDRLLYAAKHGGRDRVVSG